MRTIIDAPRCSCEEGVQCQACRTYRPQAGAHARHHHTERVVVRRVAKRAPKPSRPRGDGRSFSATARAAMLGHICAVANRGPISRAALALACEITPNSLRYLLRELVHTYSIVGVHQGTSRHAFTTPQWLVEELQRQKARAHEHTD